MAVENEMEAVFKSSRTEKDPVSGNDVPPGSLPEEVRDDIPAQLSEGEYVVPADVVRYYGVKFFEDLRMQAKMGFEEMDAQGRIGGEPMDGMDIVEPEDDLPFDLEDLEVIEVIEMDEGGDVARRGMITAGSPDDPLGALGLGSEGLGLGATASNVEIRKYVNEDGNVLMVMFINGEPVTPIPEGYFLEEVDTVEPGEKVTSGGTVAQAPAAAAQPVYADDNDDGPDIEPPEAINYEELTIDELTSMVSDQRSPKGNTAALAFGAINPIMGLAIKIALEDQHRRIGKELQRRLESTTLTAQEREKVTGLLEQHKAEPPNFLKQILAGFKGETYTPEVTPASVTLPTTPTPEGLLDLSVDEMAKQMAPPEQFSREEYRRAQERKARKEREAAEKAAAEEAARQRDAQARAARASSVSYSDSGTESVIQQMRDRGASEAAVQQAEKEAEKVESAVKDIQRGVQRGFKKGGLASKKKK
jgi:hypothetical protein